MILAFALAVAALENPQCDPVRGALAKDQCLLAQSMELKPAPDCKARLTQFDMNVCSYRDYLEASIQLNRV